MRRQHALAFVIAAVLVGAAATASATAAGGLSISPSVLETTAAPGRVGGVTIANTSSTAILVHVRAHPWRQPRSGIVVSDVARSLAGVRLNASSFSLAAGARRTIGVSLLRTPRSGSVYGNLEFVGTPQGASPASGVRTRYRLIGALRLNPPAAKRVLRVEVGRIKQRGRTAVAAVRNVGNTVTPVAGSIRIVGGAGIVRTTIAEARILPGKAVDVSLRSGTLQPGRYVADVTLRQGRTNVATVKRRFTVR